MVRLGFRDVIGNTSNRLAFIPMEIKARELDSRLLIALELASRGLTVFLGEKTEVNRIIREYRGAIYLAKSGSLVDQSFFSKLKSSGHVIVVLDEEAIIHQNEDAHVRSRFNRETIAMVDRMFSWGKYDNKVATEAFPEDAEKFLVTGNPRIDLLRREMRGYFSEPAAELNQKYGRYIFIPSSFAMCNHFTEPGARIEWRRRLGMITSPEDEAFYQAYVDHFDSIFKSFLQDIPRLAARFEERHFIVRPHPSENREVWEKTFRDVPNVIVESGGPIAPWLLASDLVIHNGCTTAIESFLLDRLVLSYRPFVSADYDLDVPNDISVQAYSYDELEKLTGELLADGAPDGYAGKGKKILENYLHSLDGPYAFELITDALNSMPLQSRMKHDIKSILRNLRLRASRFRRKKSRPSYSTQKFPELTLDEVQRLIGRYRRIQFRDVNFDLRQVSSNLFLLG